ncbi:enoyl-CoA hydratase/isomerase family protein [Texcoconibacillus texcoconensis]|uniref:Enoyl-CoA hydratase/carnithine racemase n=1 Tax=Texcoconibacillus texcoconensis TaxID=1095777 RepID=A0A840QLE4_9BACI|nr:enoyl-CoA hydratase/isomerase family protein [Texcoconibacillus texcoconensis]MBB5172189.1 enoyl-CoA hydratase/carnithine racemase [Texcoconibacillus texcoconensis]
MKVLLKEEVQPGVLVWSLNRPRRKNAVNWSLITAFQEALKEIEHSDSTKMLIIRGEGGAFCAGGDLQAFHALTTKEEAETMLIPMADVIYRIATLPFPTVAYLDGPAVGGGAELATACDWRVAKPKTKLGFIQAKLHLTTGWGGGALLRRRVQSSIAMQMLMSGVIYDSEQANRIGFVDYITGKWDGLLEWLEPVLNQSYEPLIRYKQQILTSNQFKGLREEMKREAKQCALLWEREAHLLAVEEFIETKRHQRRYD